jgi:hypothetical protein
MREGFCGGTGERDMERPKAAGSAGEQLSPDETIGTRKTSQDSRRAGDSESEERPKVEEKKAKSRGRQAAPGTQVTPHPFDKLRACGLTLPPAAQVRRRTGEQWSR